MFISKYPLYVLMDCHYVIDVKLEKVKLIELSLTLKSSGLTQNMLCSFGMKRNFIRISFVH